MRAIIMGVAGVLVLVLSALPADADTVELDFFTLGCPSTYDHNSPSWTSDFDLGITFSQIDHVYIDWSGEITGRLAIPCDDPDNPFPVDVEFLGSLGSNPWPRTTSVMGGGATYPNPESFDELSEADLLGTSTWSDLLNGQGTITLSYMEYSLANAEYIEHGSISLDSATLVVDGVIIPEPATALLLGVGAFAAKNTGKKDRFVL